MLALQSFRKKLKGLPDLLNYSHVIDDGIVLGKDGSFLAAWRYRGEDHATLSTAQLNAMSANVNAVLNAFGAGWMTHHECVRRPAAAYIEAGQSHFPDPISKLIDQERRSYFEGQGEHYESQHVWVVTFNPPGKKTEKLERFVFSGDEDHNTHLADVALRKFKTALSAIEGRLAPHFHLARLKGEPYSDEYGGEHVRDELLSFLHFCVTGIDQPINLPSVPAYLDAVIGGQEMTGGVAPVVGRKHTRIIGLEGFPQDSYPGILAALDQVPIPYRWSTRFIFLESWEAERGLERFRKKWEQKRKPLREQLFKTSGGQVDLDADEMTGDAHLAKSEAASGLVKYGYYTSVIVIMHEDRTLAEEAAEQVVNEIQRLGFAARLETVNAMEAWLGALPGHGVQNIRRPLLNTMNLADLLPLGTVWPGLAENPCPFYPPHSPPLLYGATDGSTPFRVNLHVGDIGHTLMIGPTGSGKSTALQIIAAQFRRYRHATVWLFDKDYSGYSLCQAVGGEHYDVGDDAGGVSFAPLANLTSARDLAWASQWLESIAQLQGVSVTPEQRQEIHRALTVIQASEHKTLTAYVATIQDQAIRTALEPYIIGEQFGDLFDAEQDSMAAGSYQVFEIGQLMNLGERAVLPALDYLFYRIEKGLKGQPAMLILDEAWVMLGHPVFREKIREWLKVLRKANCVVLLATQSLSDAKHSGIFDVINESCPTKILLANAQAMDEDIAPLYRLMGLNARQIETIAYMTPKRDYYYVSPLGRRRFRLDLGPIALAFAGVSGREEVTAVKRLVRDIGPLWPMRWLEQQGIAT